MKKLSFLIVTLLLSVCAWAQTTVKGVVVDSSNQPVIGAGIVEAGNTGNGVISDLDGAFTIKVPSSASLQVSCIGYAPKTVAVNGKNEIIIVLDEDSELLDDVVVVAFGKTTKEAFTGSAGTMKADALEKVQVSNATQALAGRVAGVQITNSSAQLGSSPQIAIRGIGSISSDTQPLIVVDGMPFDGDLNLINSTDIESMTVLKDAASNALYGARGANGVIMITTKKGTTGEARVTFDVKYGGNQKGLPNYKRTNTQQFYETYYNMLYNTYLAEDGATAASAHARANSGLYDSGVGPGYVVYSVPTGEDFILQGGKMNPKAVPGAFYNFGGNTYWLQADNWEKEGLRTGLRAEYNLSASGRIADKINVYSSLGYLDQDGIQEGSDQKRLTARLKMDYQAKDWLKIGANFNFTNYTNSRTSEGTIGTGTIWSVIKTQAPIYPVYIRDANGRIMTDEYGRQVYDLASGQLGTLSRAGGIGGNAIFSNKYSTDVTKGNSVIASGYADIKIIDGLILTINGNAYSYRNTQTYIDDPYTDKYTAGSQNGYVYKGADNTFTYNTQQLLNYNKTFGQHDVSAMLGHEYYNYFNEYIGASGWNFGIGGATELHQMLNKNTPDSYSSEYNNEGFFFRGMYNYAQKYYGSVSFRRDASSRFAKDHRWGNFWSVGGAWIISKESFFNVPWVDNLKFKASIGSQGNDNIGEFLYADSYDIVNNSGKPAYQWKQKGTEDITWETNTNFNTGFEFDLFKGRLSGSIDYFYRLTSDMLFSLNTPPSVGYTSYYLNMGDMRNSGVELVLNAALVQTKEFQWDVDFNISHVSNKVLSLPEEVKTTEVEGMHGYVNDDASFVSKYKYFVAEGQSLYTWYLPKYAGVDQNTGNALYYTDKLDENGAPIGTTQNVSEATEYLCGDALPMFQGGLATSLAWKGFDLSIATTFQLGGKGFDYVYQSLMHTGAQTSATWHVDILDAWTPDNKSATIPALRASNQYGQTPRSDRFLTSTSYISLQNVNFGYTLPQSLTRRAKLEKVRIYFSGENLCFLSARRGFDPRYSIGGYTNPELYSPIRTLSGGVTLTF